MRQEIEESLQVLIGMPFWKTGRAADLQWFLFGERKTVSDRRGGVKEIGSHSLHVQCAWRIVRSHTIFVASRDRYYPAGDPYNEPENFDWDVRGANRCDERCTQFFRQVSVPFVESIAADEIGGLCLTFNGEVRLELMPDDSLDAEHWRFFESESGSKHFVVTGSGIE